MTIRMLRNCLAIGFLVAAGTASAMTRIGIITDTHIGAKGAAERLERTYRLLKSHGVTNIFNLGDIADRHVDAWYKEYVDVRARVYPEGVDEVFVYHNHDQMGYHSKDPDADRTKIRLEAFAEAKRKLGARNDIYHSFKLEGFTFLVYPQGTDYERMESEIRASVAEDPGKPVFVLDHVPPLGTSAGSEGHGSNVNTLKIFRKYPQIVALTGHVHGSAANEAKIWQREFTAIGFGTTKERVAENADYHIAIMELDAKKAVIRRYSLLTGREFHADDPWTLTFPFDPRNPRYSREVRAKTTPRPMFAKDAKIFNVHPTHDHVGGLVISFPGAQNADWTSHYDVTIEDEHHDHEHPRSVVKAGNGLYAVPEEKRKRNITTALDPGLFERGEKVTVAVTPVGFFGNRGNSISTDTTITTETEPGWTTVFKGLPKGAKKGEFVKCGTFRFPNEVWDAPPGTPYRFIFEISVKQPVAQCLMEIVTEDRHQFIGKHMLDAGDWTRRFSFTRPRPKCDGPWMFNVLGNGNKIEIRSFEIQRRTCK